MEGVRGMKSGEQGIDGWERGRKPRVSEEGRAKRGGGQGGAGQCSVGESLDSFVPPPPPKSVDAPYVVSVAKAFFFVFAFANEPGSASQTHAGAY